MIRFYTAIMIKASVAENFLSLYGEKQMQA